MSPGTSWSIGTETSRAVASHGCLHRHRPAQCLDRILRPDLLDEIEGDAEHDDEMMMTKLGTSPVAADKALATSRMMISGLRKRARNCSQSGERLTVAASFGPYVASRDCTSGVSNPAAFVLSRARSRSVGSCHTCSGPGSPDTGYASVTRGTSLKSFIAMKSLLLRHGFRCGPLKLRM